MSERIDDLEKTVCKLVEDSNINDSGNDKEGSNNTITNNNKDYYYKNTKTYSNKLDSEN